MLYEIELASAPAEAEVSAVTAGLSQFEAAEGRPGEYVPLTLFLRDDSGKVVGGLIGNTGPEWMYVSTLWIAEPLRGAGFGGKLMDAAEAEALQRRCSGVYLDTLSSQALGFYLSRGYQQFGELDGYPGDRKRHFLKKKLVPSQDAELPKARADRWAAHVLSRR